MNVASSLTIAQLDGAGLPSFQSSESGKPVASSAQSSAKDGQSAEKPEPAKDSESFDEVLAQLTSALLPPFNQPIPPQQVSPTDNSAFSSEEYPQPGDVSTPPVAEVCALTTPANAADPALAQAVAANSDAPRPDMSGVTGPLKRIPSENCARQISEFFKTSEVSADEVPSPPQIPISNESADTVPSPLQGEPNRVPSTPFPPPSRTREAHGRLVDSNGESSLCRTDHQINLLSASATVGSDCSADAVSASHPFRKHRDVAVVEQASVRESSDHQTRQIESLEAPDSLKPLAHAASNSHGAEPTSLADQLANGIGRQLDEPPSTGTVELHLRLDPPDLGTVRVHLRMVDGVMSVRLFAADESVTRLLESQLSHLQQSLAERGLAFGQCDVFCGGGQHSSDRNPNWIPTARGSTSRATWLTPSLTTQVAERNSERLDLLA